MDDAIWFSTLDLKSGHCHVVIHPERREKILYRIVALQCHLQQNPSRTPSISRRSLGKIARYCSWWTIQVSDNQVIKICEKIIDSTTVAQRFETSKRSFKFFIYLFLFSDLNMCLTFIYFYTLFYALNATLQEDALARYEQTKYLLPFLLNTTNNVAQLSEVGQQISSRLFATLVVPPAVQSLQSLEPFNTIFVTSFHINLLGILRLKASSSYFFWAVIF